MNVEEKAQLDDLCKQIVVEKDHHRFMALVIELNQLLERKERRLQPRSETNPEQG